MPRVPSLDTFQTGIAQTSPGRFDAPSGPGAGDFAARQLGQVGQAMQQAGTVAGRIAADMQEQANQVRVNDAMSQLVKARTDLQVDALQQRGRNALERPDGKALPDEYADKLRTARDELDAGLGNSAQRLVFRQQASQIESQLRERLGVHIAQEFRSFRTETQKATIDTAVNQGALLWGDEGMRAQSLGAIRGAVGQMAADQGWDAATREAASREAESPLHAGVMRGMIQAGQPGQARAYYDGNSANMSLQARAQMQEVIKHASDAQSAESTADDVWSSLGPQSANDAVRIFDMEKEMRAKLKDSPEALSLGLSGLRQRAQAFNAQQAESNAQGINGVYGLLDQGVPLARITKSDTWLSLPDKSRHEILKALESEAAVREQRAAAAESRSFTRLQREQQATLLRNADAYLDYTDPQKLGTMTRAQVAALRPMFGMEATQHLLTRFDSIGRRDGQQEARIDNDTFNQVAQDMGLDPFKPRKSEEERAQLGALKYRIERLIDTAQQAKKDKLTVSEKETLVREEMSRQVTVDPGLFSSTHRVPVIGLSPAQAATVVVPKGERAKIVDALKAMYARDPENPEFAPTEQNVRRAYLRAQSKAGALINAQ